MQDETGIFNCENIYIVGTEIRVASDSIVYTILGTYKTKKRAMEILKEIFECFIYRETYYRMPKE